SPKVRAMPAWLIAPWLAGLMTMAPLPAKTSAKAPRNSESHFFMSVWRAGAPFSLRRFAVPDRQRVSRAAAANAVVGQDLVRRRRHLRAPEHHRFDVTTRE